MNHPTIAFLTTACLLGLAGPAGAETIHLKSGTLVRGKIVKEDLRAFTVETPEGRRKVVKKDVETIPPPDPWIVTGTGVLAGGGQIYEGELARGLLYLAAGVGLAAVAYYAGRQIRPSTPGVGVLMGIGAYALPTAAGIIDARHIAQARAAEPRYLVDYDAAP